MEVFWRLVKNTDVIVQNYRKGAAERLGISFDQVRHHKPDIVYASLNSYGYMDPGQTAQGMSRLHRPQRACRFGTEAMASHMIWNTV